jgi:hypothetical protein
MEKYRPIKKMAAKLKVLPKIPPIKKMNASLTSFLRKLKLKGSNLICNLVRAYTSPENPMRSCEKVKKYA